jgi:hypothetical protein
MKGHTMVQFTAHKNPQPTGAKWKIVPPKDKAKPGWQLQVKVAGNGSHDLELKSDIFVSNVSTHNDHAVATIKDGLEKKLHYFDVYIDGEKAEAASSPAVIIE